MSFDDHVLVGGLTDSAPETGAETQFNRWFRSMVSGIRCDPRRPVILQVADIVDGVWSDGNGALGVSRARCLLRTEVRL
jgi:hypothetical protein